MQIWLGKQYLGQTDKPIPQEPEDAAKAAESLRLFLATATEAIVRHGPVRDTSD
jgi:hypothetical protein